MVMAGYPSYSSIQFLHTAQKLRCHEDGRRRERREANIDSMDPENDFLLPLLLLTASTPFLNNFKILIPSSKETKHIS